MKCIPKLSPGNVQNIRRNLWNILGNHIWIWFFSLFGNPGTPRIKISCLWFNNRRLARIEWQARQTFAFCEWVENGKRQRETRKRVHGIDLFICITFHFVWSVFWILDCRDLGYWALYLNLKYISLLSGGILIYNVIVFLFYIILNFFVVVVL